MSNSDCLPQKNIDTLYKDHQGYLFAWLRKKLGCSESAADIAQDTFVRILQHRHKTGELPDFREPRAYLTTVAGRLMHDLFRKQALEKAYLEALAQIPESIAPSAEEEHQIYALLYELDTILESLKPIVRQVFLLSQLQGLTYNEIAHKLAISERSVKRYMAMAFEECLILMMQVKHMSNTTISRDVARKAANWLVLLHSDDSTPAQESACLAWRKENPEHENAWLKAQALQQKLGILPPLLAMNTLNRVERYDRRKAIKSLVVLITSVPVAYATYKTLPWYGLNAQYQTSMGEQQHIMLEDGTEVFLNTDTRLDVNYTAQQRTLELYSGEILIQTGSDTNNRPFFVKTRQGLLRPIGTRFLVRELNKQQVHLSVLQGAVEVQPTHASNQSFSAGQQTYFSEQKIALAQTNQAQNDAWVRGVLYADNMPLAQFVNELSRYRRGILRCDPAVAMLGISGTFQLNNIDNILTALPDTLPVSVDFLLGYWVTVKAKNSA